MSWKPDRTEFVEIAVQSPVFRSEVASITIVESVGVVTVKLAPALVITGEKIFAGHGAVGRPAYVAPHPERPGA